MAEQVNIGDVVSPQADLAPAKGVWKLSQRGRDNIAGFLFISPWLIHFLGLIAFAMAFSFGISLTKTDLLTGYKFIGFDNYITIFKMPAFWESLYITLKYIPSRPFP